MLSRPTVVVFDIFETVMSIESLRDRFEAVGQPGSMLETWFASGLRDAFAIAVAGGFKPFADVLEGALDQLFADRLSREQKRSIVEGMGELKPHADARACFSRLAEAGFRIVALSNGAPEVTKRLLAAADLDGFVERVGSVNDAHVSKPHARVYRTVLEQCGVPPEQACLVACHAWDVNGALAAGLGGVYVARNAHYPRTMTQPSIVAETLSAAADALVALPA